MPCAFPLVCMVISSIIIHVKGKDNIFITVYSVIKLYMLRLVIFTQFLVTSLQCVVICSLTVLSS